ncbi:MAG: histidine kinase [Bryobacterales bacterium]|nr:histidine kinase [Bryobacterales bacterium]
MHPLLVGKRGQFYVLAWLPVAGMLSLFFRQAAGGMNWFEALTLAFPLCALYAIVCLSSWYLCRMAPLAKAGPVRIAAPPLLASLIAAAVWINAGRLLASALSSARPFAGLEDRFQRHETSLWISGVLLFLLSTSLCYLLAEIEAVREAREREIQSAVMAREAELKALRDQVSPHFLFNSLHSISALAGIDKQKAREMCALLADFLRTSLTIADRRFIPLEEELALTRKYLAIEQVRFGERLHFEESIEPAALDSLVPPLILQPLVENAVKHGIGQCLEGGAIRLEARNGANDILLALTNTTDSDASKPAGARLGLANLRRRLETLYRGGARLTTSSSPTQYRAEIQLWKQPPKEMR